MNVRPFVVEVDGMWYVRLSLDAEGIADSREEAVKVAYDKIHRIASDIAEEYYGEGEEE